MIKVDNISKMYHHNKIISNINLEIPEHSFVCITGPSGSGKTTLLNLLSLIEKPNAGSVDFDGLKNPSPRTIQKLRREKIGYIFQNYGLIDNETVKKNLDTTSKFKQIKSKDKVAIYTKALEAVGLNKSYLSKRVFHLSGGEQQRVALVRLIITQPKYIFADEPTGNLDTANRDRVFKLLEDFYKNGSTVVYVTHDKELVQKGQFVIELERCAI